MSSLSISSASSSSSSSFSSISSHIELESDMQFDHVSSECSQRMQQHKQTIDQLHNAVKMSEELAKLFPELMTELQDLPEAEKNATMKKFTALTSGSQSHAVDDFESNAKCVMETLSSTTSSLLQVQHDYGQMHDFLASVKTAAEEGKIQVDTDYHEWAKNHAPQQQTRLSALFPHSNASSSLSPNDEEDVTVLNPGRNSKQYIDILSQLPILDPARSNACSHIYSFQSITTYIQEMIVLPSSNGGSAIKCPYSGCTQALRIECIERLRERDAEFQQMAEQEKQRNLAKTMNATAILDDDDTTDIDDAATIHRNLKVEDA